MLPTYNAADKVIWGGKVWSNSAGNVGASTNALNLNAEWASIAVNNTDYKTNIDYIEYDVVNDIITTRKDRNGNIVSATLSDRLYFTAKGLVGNPINVFQWNNPYVTATNRGTSNNKVVGGYAENINNIGSFYNNIIESKSILSGNITYIASFILNKMNELSEIRNNVMHSATINANILQQGSTYTPFGFVSISSNVLFTGDIKENLVTTRSSINSNTLDNGYIYFNILRDTCTINSNRLIGGQIRDNNLNYSGTINSNNLASNGLIRLNTIEESNINSNTLNVSGYITRNKMQAFARINSNTIGGVDSGNPSSISTNTITAGDIEGNTLTGARCDIAGNVILIPLSYTDAP